MQMIPMAIGQGLNNAQYRNRGQSTGLLGGPGAIDGTAQSFYNFLDPANFTGKASSGHVLANFFDPGNVFGFNQAANPYGPGGVPGGAGGMSGSALPNLGDATLMARMPGGAFQRPDMSGGRFNDMAALGAGRLFNPAMPQRPLGGVSGSKGAVGQTPGGAGGAKPNQPTLPINPQMLERLRQMQGGRK